MNVPLIAVGIGNTTIAFGLGNFLAPSTTDATSQANARWQWSRTFTVKTAEFDPSTLPIEIPEQVVWRVASVHRPSEQRLARWVRESQPQAAYQSLTWSDLPIDVRVPQPHRVGMDRLVAAVAVNQVRTSDRAAVIVDAGTAITVDMVNAEGVFVGGAILPGLQLASRALAAQTDLLPLVDPNFDQPPAALATATEEAIRSGLFWGTVGAVRELATRIGETSSGPAELFLTGGDAERLAPYIADNATFVGNLVLDGIMATEAARSSTES